MMKSAYTKERTRYPNALGITLIILFSILSIFTYLIVAAILDKWILPEVGFKRVEIGFKHVPVADSQQQLISFFTDQDPVTKNFKGRLEQIKHLAFDGRNQHYACTCCGKTFSTVRHTQQHFSQGNTAHNQSNKHPHFRHMKNLADQINALTHMQKHGNSLTGLNQAKRKYDNSYAVKNLPGLFPGFLAAAATIPPESRSGSPTKHFSTLLKNGHILTKSFPEMYGSASSHRHTFQGIPTSFLSIFNQLSDETYKPTPRDTSLFASGANNPNKWVFDCNTSSWMHTQVTPKVGRKQPKPYMQKNSTTLASAGGNYTFGGSGYATAIAYDANKSRIDDQYTWRENAVTASKWWYGSSPSKNQNPSSFLGVQLQNLFCTAQNETAPQNEILARPNIESVVASIAITDGISAKLSSFLQAKYINTFINGRSSTISREVPTLIKRANGQYIPYSHQETAEHISRLFFSYRIQHGLSLNTDEMRVAQDALAIPNSTVDKLYQKLGVAFIEKPIKDALNILANRLDANANLNIDTTGLKRWINSMPHSYSDSYPRFIVADYVDSTQLSNNAKVASGANADIVKDLLRKTAGNCLSGNKVSNQVYSVILKEIQSKRKIWRSPDVINAFCIFGNQDGHKQADCVLEMIKSMTPNSLSDLLRDHNKPVALADYITRNAHQLNLTDQQMLLLEEMRPSAFSRFIDSLNS